MPFMVEADLCDCKGKICKVVKDALPQKKAHRKERWEEEEKAGCLKKIVLKTMYVFAYECKS